MPFIPHIRDITDPLISLRDKGKSDKGIKGYKGNILTTRCIMRLAQ